ncbi:MAG: DUF4347 domain-containing protein [Cyanobacteria bacterium J06621_3]
MPSSVDCSCTAKCDRRATTAKPSRVAIFDSRVSDLSTLLAGLQPDVQSFVLDADRDGIEQISEILEQAPADELTVVARGFCGGLHIGDRALTLSNLPHYEHQLRNWFSGKTSPSLTLLAGEVAQRTTGKAFVNQLTTITGATVRASAMPIGQGHWLTATAKTFRPLVLNTYSATL